MAHPSLKPTTDPIGLCRDLTVAAIVLFTRDGTLIDANRGFLRLFGAPDSDNPPSDIRSIFINPGFDQIIDAPVVKKGSTLYRGLLNMGSLDREVRSYRAHIHEQDGHLLLVAEEDMEVLRAANQRLTAQMLPMPPTPRPGTAHLPRSHPAPCHISAGYLDLLWQQHRRLQKSLETSRGRTDKWDEIQDATLSRSLKHYLGRIPDSTAEFQSLMADVAARCKEGKEAHPAPPP
ncbi:hypothetical protein [Magnetospira sp. QH-2]|uniref:hypothetical protein n=1 Tax=Magnetospira sp. (strain QH-2) TaxID=1288970 RepID=UPI0003E81643|nr:hypothetical protein [Magnetospira sp. QH-2]CCQ75267.1 protein of unknown function [Magnetospira sp. QH-2]